MDNFKKLLTKIVAPSTGVLAYTVFAAIDLEFYINGNTIFFENDSFLFLLVLLVFAFIPLVLIIGSSILYVNCNSDKGSWLSRKSIESAESYEKAKKEAEEYNS
jgi:hypothetical protein